MGGLKVVALSRPSPPVLCTNVHMQVQSHRKKEQERCKDADTWVLSQVSDRTWKVAYPDLARHHQDTSGHTRSHMTASMRVRRQIVTVNHGTGVLWVEVESERFFVRFRRGVGSMEAWDTVNMVYPIPAS